MTSTTPAWDDLRELAAGQAGFFTRAQAAKHGISAQLLRHHERTGAVERAARSVFRFRSHPHGERDDLVPIALWAGAGARFSHATALALHQLSDALPNKIHLSVPVAWRRRRVATPKRVVLHYADPYDDEVGWVGALPVTNIVATIADCIRDDVDATFVRQAIAEARSRGSIDRPSAQRLTTRLNARLRREQREADGGDEDV